MHLQYYFILLFYIFVKGSSELFPVSENSWTTYVKLDNAKLFLSDLSESENFELEYPALNNGVRSCIKFPGNYSIFKPNEEICTNWICPNSQLTLINKHKILILYNRFRQNVALGECKYFCKEKIYILNMQELHWHWTLEQEAININNDCKDESFYNDTEFRNDINGLGKKFSCQTSGMFMRTDRIGQNDFMYLLEDLLERNEMYDFDENNYSFKRTNVTYFGCSLVERYPAYQVRDYIYVHFTCVFCSRYYSKLITTTDCPLTSAIHENLCNSEDVPSVFACEPDIKDVCKEQGEFLDSNEFLSKPITGLLIETSFVYINNVGVVPFINYTDTDMTVGENGSLKTFYNSVQYIDPSYKEILHLYLYDKSFPLDRCFYGDHYNDMYINAIIAYKNQSNENNHSTTITSLPKFVLFFFVFLYIV